jgi:DNA primase
LFYCHGCGRGGDVIRVVELLDGVSFRAALDRLQPNQPMEWMLEQAHRFYEQLAGHRWARQYLAARGIHAAEVIARMRIGYAPGGCLRGHLERLGYGRQAPQDAGLVDARPQSSNDSPPPSACWISIADRPAPLSD